MYDSLLLPASVAEPTWCSSCAHQQAHTLTSVILKAPGQDPGEILRQELCQHG